MSTTTQTSNRDAATPKPEPAPARRKRILLAEGNGFTRLILMVQFRLAGFEVDFTSNGSVALTKMRERQPDALLAGLKLGGMTGLELVKAARSEAAFGSRPIYLFAHADQMTRAARKEARALAAQVFDKRQLSPERLVQTLAAALNNGGSAASQPPANGTEGAETGASEDLVLPEEVQEIIDGVKAQAKLLGKRRTAKERIETSAELRARVCSLASCADIVGLRNLARQARALEGLLQYLPQQWPDLLDAGMGTVMRAVEVMRLMSRQAAGRKKALSTFRAVVIDEATASNAALKEALSKAGFEPVTFHKPAAAREYLASNAADVIVVNLLHPAAHGLALAEIRQLPSHASTPTVIAPESTVLNRFGSAPAEEAPPLDKKPLLLKEIILQALNQTQSARKAAPNAPAADATDAELLADDTNEAIEEVYELTPEPAEQPIEVRAAAAAEPVAEQSQPANPEKTILFIEDDPFVVRVYKKYLKRERFNVEVAEDGAKALEMLPQVKPDAVILDLMLPKLHGLEVLKFMRADDSLKGTPVLVLSNAYLDGLATQAHEAGANQGIRKTECTPAKLVEAVCEMTGRPPSKPLPQPVVHGLQPMPAYDQAVSMGETAVWVRQAGLRKDSPREIAKIRQECRTFVKAASIEERMASLTEIYRRVRFLGARADLGGLPRISELTSALEGLIYQILFKQSEATPSTCQTIAQAVDCLDRLANSRDVEGLADDTRHKVLLVDNDTAFALSMASALNRANFEAVGLPNPATCLDVLSTGSFDVILLSVDMPHISGFDVCEQLRRMPQYKSASVIFVTDEAHLQDRARSVICGGNDLLVKPVCPLELILKVTMHLLQSGRHSVAESADASSATALPYATEATADAQGVRGGALSAEVAAEQAAELASIFQRSASVSCDPVQPAAPSEVAAASPVETAFRLKATTVEKGLTDESQVEELHRVVLDPETPDRLAPQPVVEGPQTDGEALPTAGESSLATARADSGAEAGVAEAGSPVNRVVADPAQTEESNAARQIQDLQDECARQRETAEKYQNERQALATRICTTEMDLHRSKVRLERSDKIIEDLHKQLEDLNARQTQTGGQSEEQLNAATAAVNEANRAQQEAQARCAQLEQELRDLRQAREDLNGKLASEQQTATDSRTRAENLEKELSSKSAELDQSRTELEKQTAERALAEADLRKNLEAANDALAKTETAQEKAQSRCAHLEQELASLWKEHEALDGKFAREQQVTAESRARMKNLETELGAKAADLDRSKAELEKQADQRARLEADSRRQLEAANTTLAQTEAAHKQAQARCEQLEKELNALRQAREELGGQVAKEQQVTTESRGRIKELETQLGSKAKELDRTKAELEKQAAERGRMETELRRQAEGAAAALKQAEAGQKQAQARCGDLEKELDALRQAREEINGKLNNAHLASVDSGKRVKELEGYLSKRSAELMRAKRDLEKHGLEHTKVESTLREQLEAATAAAKQNEAANKQAQARCGQLEKELNALRQAREELNGKLAEGGQAAEKSAQRIQDLEKELEEKSSEQKRAGAELQNQTKDHGRAESEVRAQLEAAETARKQAQARCAELEKELDALRQAREELNSKFAKELQVSAESRNRIKDLEAQLSSKSAELERSRAELEKQAAERGRTDADLRRQVESANATLKQGEAAQKLAQARCGELEKELSGLRQAREELSCKLADGTQVTQKSAIRIQELESQLKSKATELDRTKADLEKQAAERSRVEADLRRQVDGANATLKQGEAAQKQAQARCGELEKDLNALRQAREELNGKLAKELQAGTESRSRIKDLETQLNSRATDLERAKADLQKQISERERTEADLRRKVESANATLKQGEAAQTQAQARCGELEKELGVLRQAREELNCKLADGTQVTQKSSLRIRELEKSLQEKSAALDRSKADLEKQTADRSRVEADLRRQVDSANATLKQGETAQKQAQARCGQLEQELNALRQAREELNGKLTEGTKATQKSSKRIQDLEKSLQEKSAALDRSKAELAKQTAEHSRMEADLRRQIESASATLKQGDVAQKQAEGRCGQLEQELNALRQAREGLNRQLASEMQAGTESRNRIKDLETQLNSKATDLDRTKAELEKQAAERGRLEADSRRQLEAANAALKQGDAAQKQAQARCEQLEQELNALRQAREALNGKLAKELQAGTESRSRVKDLETQLNSKAIDLDRTRTELEQQTAERGRTEAELRRQVENANATLKQGEAARHQAEVRCEQLGLELNALRQAREELDGKFVKELQVTTESRNRIKDLEAQVNALRQVREELDGRLGREQRAGAQSLAQIKELENQAELSASQHGAQVADLEQRIRQGVSDLARSTADLAKERGARQRSEQHASTLNTQLQELHAELSRTLESHRANLERLAVVENRLRQTDEALARRTADYERQQAARQLAEEELRQAREANGRLRKSLAFLEESNKAFDRTQQTLHSKLEAGLASLRESEKKFHLETTERQRLADTLGGVQQQLDQQTRKRETVEAQLQTALGGLQAAETNFQQESAERRRLASSLEDVEHRLDQQTRKREELEAQLQTALAEVRTTEAKFQQESAERRSLADTLGGVQQRLDQQTRTREALEAQFQTTLGGLRAAEARLQTTTAERQTLQAALDASQASLRECAQHSALECSKFQSAFQVEQAERKHRETQIARMRHASLNAMRSARVLRNSLRKQIHEPVQNLYHSVQGLLETEMTDQQTKLFEAVLENVLLVRARLQEAETAQANSNMAAPQTEAESSAPVAAAE